MRRSVLVSVGLLFLGSVSLQASDCSEWPTCNLSLTSNQTPDAITYPNHVFDVETDHFTFFLDPTNPYYPDIDPAKYQIAQDQLECAYRYFVCEVGLPLPLTDKTQVYIEDYGHATFGHNTIGLLGSIVTYDPLRNHKLYTQPVHEFFHRLKSSSGSYTGNTAVAEGMASLGEQMVSAENFTHSLADAIGARTTMLTQPENSFTYGLNIFYRFTSALG